MTPADLFALCDAPGWSPGRVAREVCAGRHADTLRDWQARHARGEPLPDGVSAWLAGVRVESTPGETRVIVPAVPVPRRGGWPRRAAVTTPPE